MGSNYYQVSRNDGEELLAIWNEMAKKNSQNWRNSQVKKIVEYVPQKYINAMFVGNKKGVIIEIPVGKKHDGFDQERSALDGEIAKRPHVSVYGYNEVETSDPDASGW